MIATMNEPEQPPSSSSSLMLLSPPPPPPPPLPESTLVDSFMERLDDLLVLQEIVKWIGPNQYRFVAGINRRFHHVYLQEFPPKVT